MRFPALAGLSLFALATLFGPHAARAGDCPGMDHYTYDHGECTDKSGDTFDVMEKAYDDSYRQGVDMTERGRSSGTRGGSRGGRFSTADMARDITAIVGFTPSAVSPAIPGIVARMRPGLRAQSARMAEHFLAAYDAFAPQHGFYTTSYPSAILFATEAAYLAYDGDHFGSPRYPGTVYYMLSNALAHWLPATRLTDLQKQQVNDANVIAGVGFLMSRADAEKRHDAGALATVRKQARGYLIALWQRDPATTRIDDLVCLGGHAGSCDGWKSFLSGGTLGVSPFAGMLRGFGSRSR